MLERILGIIWALGLLAIMLLILIGIPVLIIKLMRKTSSSVTDKLFKGIELKSKPRKGHVLLEYTTYDGFIFWVSSKTYAGYLPPPQARELLKRMFWYNMKYGLFNYFLVFVLLFSIVGYQQQKNSIEEQELAF